MAIDQKLADQMAFIPFPDGLEDSDFADWMNRYGRSDYLDVEGGIVVLQKDEEDFKRMVQKAAED